MVPLGVFRNPQFSGANLVTFAVYAALGAIQAIAAFTPTAIRVTSIRR